MSTILRLTTDEYHAMIARGAFEDLRGRHVQLINGELRQMSPQGPWHSEIVRLLTRWSYRVLNENEVTVSVQSPLELADFDSEPEPDLAWIKQKSYAAQHPVAADVLLLIEVSFSSLADDLGERMELYARGGIQDYWVVDLPNRLVHVLRQPSPNGYLANVPQSSGELRPLALPHVSLSIEKLFAQ